MCPVGPISSASSGTNSLEIKMDLLTSELLVEMFHQLFVPLEETPALRLFVSVTFCFFLQLTFHSKEPKMSLITIFLILKYIA